MTTISKRRPPIDSTQLDPLRKRLQAWRADRRPGQHMPEELWEAAAQLARVQGVSRTATALKLSYYQLQRRVGPAPMRQRRGVASGFVELPALGPVPSASHPGTVELVRSGGWQMTLRLPKASPRQLLPLVEVLLRS